jgi:predicted nucleotidyltransferase
VLERLLAATGRRLKLDADPEPEAPTLAGVRRHRAQLDQVARTYQASDVRVFGSVARGQARPGSDIDLLVSFPKGTTLLNVIGFEQDAAEILGHPVHVFAPGVLPGRFAHLEAEAVPL